MTPLMRPSLMLALAAAGLAWSADGDRGRTISASGIDLFEDTDGDLLPDTLEWVLLTDPTQLDSDGDAIDDFVEAAQFGPVRQRGQPLPLDNELRAAVYGLTAPDGTSQVMLTLLIRVVQGGSITIKPFVDFQGQRCDITQLFWNRIADARIQTDPYEGTYALASAWLGPADQIRPLLPLSIGVQGTIGGRAFMNGSVLLDASGAISTLVTPPQQMAMATSFAVHPIDAQDPALQARFWQSSKTCLVTLVPAGGAASEVADASCTGSPTLLCAPNCASLVGGVIVVPSGLPFLTGN